MSLDRSDDEAPTELDVDLSSSASGEITIEAHAKRPRDTLPADSEPQTLEPLMTVRGLGVPGDHPADHDGPTRSVEQRLLAAYASDMQRAQGAPRAERPRAPSLPTIITPSEPFRTTSPTAKIVVPAVEEEDTATDTRPVAVEIARAPLESVVDAVTEVTEAPRMLSSSELVTDPGVAGGDEPEVKEETERIVVVQTPDAAPIVVARPPELVAAPREAAPVVLVTPALLPIAPSAMETARAPRQRKSRVRLAVTLGVMLAVSTVASVIVVRELVPGATV
ncbi:MAG TPA: hypothetical protein VLT33_33580, partial [Labilithrix sp.]|nr:hypothetical protein [Labilithrix sp.]